MTRPSVTPEGTTRVAVRWTCWPRTDALNVTCFSHPCAQQRVRRCPKERHGRHAAMVSSILCHARASVAEDFLNASR